MLLVILILAAVALAALYAETQASTTSTSSAPPPPAAVSSRAALASRAATRVRPAALSPSSSRGARHWTASELPAPGREPAQLRQHYRAKGGVDFVFSFERQAGGRWRAYIERGMPYGPRPSELRPTHRLRDGSRDYVCFEPDPPSLRDVARVAAYWADMTVIYVRTGRTLDQQLAADQRTATA